MWSNKKADERVLSIYLFIIYIIVAIGIVSGVLLFYGALDIREVEAEVLTDKVIDCLTEQGKLKTGVLEWENLDNCKFNFKDNSQKYDGEEQYYVQIEFYDFDNSKEIRSSIEKGRKDFFQYCELDGDKLPKCNMKEIYILNNGDKILLRIYSVVGKVAKNE